MGMFDTITCKRIMPDGFDATDWSFQTKDLESLCDLYDITADGRLILERVCDWTGSEDRKSGAVPFDGDIHFYSFVDDQRNEGWIEYRATFRDGLMTELIVWPKGER